MFRRRLVVLVLVTVSIGATLAEAQWTVEAGGTIATVTGQEERTGTPVDLNVSCGRRLEVFFVMDLPVVSRRGMPINTTMLSDVSGTRSVRWNCDPALWGAMCTVDAADVAAVMDVLVRANRVRIGIGRGTGVFLRFPLRGSARAIGQVRRRGPCGN